MPTLSIREIYEAARSAGFTPHQAVTWTAIAMAESGGRTGALNDRGEYSMGLWQINVNADPARRTRWGNLNDPEANARAAYEISRQGRDMRPWTTTHDRNKGTRADYRTYLDDVEKETGVAGDPRGVSGYGAKLPPPLTQSQYDKIDTGQPLDPQVGADTDVSADTVDPPATPAPPVQQDTDADGLTDEFERLAGTKIDVADTDADGLSDGYEGVISRTDPLKADTDADGTPDAVEVAQGTDAGRLLGVAGVVGEGIFAENVRDGVDDADADGLSDHTEKLIGTDAKEADTDGDQLSDAMEASLGTNPLLADTDADGLTDGLEIQHGSDPLQTMGPFGQPIKLPAWTMEGAAQALAAEQTAKQGVAEPAGKLTDGGRRVGVSPSTPQTEGDRAESRAGVLGIRDTDAGSAAGADPAGVAGLGVGANGAANRVGPGSSGAVAAAGGVSAGAGGVAAAGGTAGPQGVAGGNGNTYAIDSGRPLDANRLPGAAEKDPDTDRDGLTDAFEKLAGTNAKVADTDRDGLSDGYEALVSRTDPLAADTDRDEVPDAQEIALGTDAGTLPGVAGVQGAGKYAENVRNGITDTDRDGLSDRLEKLVGTNAKKADTDGDQLSDAMEGSLGTDPLKADTDADGVADGVEVQFGSDPLSAASVLGVGGPGGPPGGAPVSGAPAGGAPAGAPVGAGVGATIGQSGAPDGLGGGLGAGLGQADGIGVGASVTGPGGVPGVAPGGAPGVPSGQGDASELLDLS